jgi:hypothetical protein
MRKLSVLTAALCFGLSTAALAAGAQKEPAGTSASGYGGSTVQAAPGSGGSAAPTTPRADSRTGTTAAPDPVQGYGSTVPPAEASAELRARALLAREGYEMVSGLKRTPWGFEGLAVREANEVRRVAVYYDGTVRSTP